MKINYENLLGQTDFSMDKELLEQIEYKEILFILSKEIIEYRKQYNLKQEDLANKLNMSQEMISKIESGNYNPTIKLLVKIWNSLSTDNFNFGATLLLKMYHKVVKNFNTINIEISKPKDFEEFKFKAENTIPLVEISEKKREGNFIPIDCKELELAC